MVDYLSAYGWHFSKKMCMWAVSRMYREDGGEKVPIEPITKQTLEDWKRAYGVQISGAEGYDDVYIANMCKADFLGTSIIDERALLQYVKDVIEDPDGYEGMPFTRFYADCVGSGTPIQWDDML